MEYERDYDREPLNFQLIGIIAIVAIVFMFMIYPVLAKSIAPKPVAPVITPAPIETKIVYQIVEIKPTPDGFTYFASEYEDGIRKTGRPYSWIRNRVVGLQDMAGHIRIYDYKEFSKLHWYNAADGRYHTMYPDSGKKFLFVFVNVYLDDVTGQDTRYYIPKQNAFIAYADDRTVYYPFTYPYYVRIKELEETFNYNEVTSVKAYGQERRYSRDLKYKETAGEYSLPIDFIYAGKSNAEDGYLVYQIDENINVNDITIAVNIFEAHPSWKLIK